MTFVRSSALPLFLALAACSAHPPIEKAEPAPTGVVASPASVEIIDAGAAPGMTMRAPRATLSTRAVSVAAIKGNLVARDAQGREAIITTGATDDAPSLSPDGMTIAFRRYRTTSLDGSHDLDLVSVTGGEPEILVPEAASSDPEPLGVSLHWLGPPEFSVDGKRVFFNVENGRIGAVCAVDLTTKKVSWILAALESELIHKGPYRGNFFAIRRETLVLNGPEIEACYVLHSTTGKKLRTVRCHDGPQGAESDPAESASLQYPSARKELGL
jgi:hypothetical protein